MNYFLMVVIGILAGFIISDNFFSDDAANHEVVNQTNVPVDRSNLDAVIVDVIEAREDLQALLETERKKFEELAERIENISYQLESGLTQSGDAAEETNRRDDRDDRNPDYNAETLVTAGLTRVEADRVLELENEAKLQVEELLSSPENRNRNAIREVIATYEDQIRTELGDYSYETYLQAKGERTSVPVGEVEPDSAGAIAGLQEGDQIISYAGERVFDIGDLQSATQSGTEGQTVILEVLRDDQTETLVIPRGEIGISTRNRR